MKKEIQTPITSIWHLLSRTLKRSVHLLFMSAVFFSIVIAYGLWTDSKFAIDFIVFGASPKVLFLIISFALAIPLAGLIGTCTKLLYSLVRRTNVPFQHGKKYHKFSPVEIPVLQK